MVYCVVKDLDLNYGFGKWNTFHSGHRDLNDICSMYEQNDFQSQLCDHNAHFTNTSASGLPEDCQIVEFLTVANYDYFKQLRLSDRKAYNQKRRKSFHPRRS